ncbi:uncharacterized protein LOC135708562 [Ochlerotatus camptorhynchus]|uniref:uncharacterized protein LOC135708562 n=1 Tax=Ochlerotatus camptorhynchus TaxID=644619 RepID=UPI0031D29236
MLKYLILTSLLAYVSATPVATFLAPASAIAYSPAAATANYVAAAPVAAPVQFAYPTYAAEFSSQSAGISRITEYEATPLVPVVAPAGYYAAYY